MQSRLLEWFNAGSHAIGLMLSIVALVVCVVFSAIKSNVYAVVGCSIYGVTLILLYAASTWYHAAKNTSLKSRLKVFDHVSIFLLIAGTYTPFLLVTLHGAWGWSLFGVVWALAIIGVVFKLFFTGRYEFFSLALYLLMGWLVVIAIKPLVHALAFAGLVWLVLGGLFYTTGVYFYATDRRYPHHHFVWHLFVLAGSACHFFAILFYVVMK